ncbi:MAG: hypothetical protein GY710_12125 [Desulfobacteraceae bacterium]|nr:hypothetical protein [Desulfobacteraceae bacterium]
MSINGNDYDWESMEIRLPSGVAVDIEEISYNDEAPIEEHYGKGGTPIGYGRKNYKAAGSMSLGLPEFERLKEHLGGSIYKGKPFQIVVSYANDDQVTVTDTLPDVKITKTDTSGKQGDDKVGARKLDFKILSPIKWNAKEAY